MQETSLWLWVGFNAFILAMLALDLGVFHRKSHEVSVKEATIWSGVWIALAMIFNAGIWYFRGGEAGIQFFTGYLIEKSLSVDNIFVIALIFGFFAVPKAYQHRVLFWGILGALVMRAIFILAGAALLARFHWIIYIFGAFLLFTGIKMALHRHEEIHPEHNPVLKLIRRLMPVTNDYHEGHFFVRHAGKLMATPLFLVLVLVETTDLIFAVDSIPAIFAVTEDPFLVYTSNIFAILGLRSLYFVLAGVMDKFVYLKLGLSAILVFVGAKMLLTEVYKIPAMVSLLVVLSILALAVVASMRKNRRDERMATELT
ncbi:MAG: tellurite resistance protein TerC [Acidobacteriota bacterium]|jgi:tellurite resistance protein TerC|nr:tellurite resistance protein TerC [Acidobacteriota bacterium]